MRIAILSDTHNQITRTQEAIDVCRAEGITEMIHCGDVTRVEMVELFTDFTLHLIYGNNDIDEVGLRLAAQSCGAGSTCGEIYTAEIDGKRLAAIHGDAYLMLDDLIRSQRFDYVFHGHTHRIRDEKIGKTRVINPGALGGSRRDRRNFCILELKTDDLAHYSMFE